MASSPPAPPPDDARRPDEFALAAPTLALVAPTHAPAHVEQPSAPAAAVDAQPAPAPSPPPPAPEDVALVARLRHLYLETSAHFTGLIRHPPLPAFPLCWQRAMASSRQYSIPHTPRVISPSPTPSDLSAKDAYFAPVTRSASRKHPVASPPPIDEDSGSDPEKRARARSRSPVLEARRRRMSGLASKRQMNGCSKAKKADLALPNAPVNGHLSPAAANKNYWREMSRSPSPLGLIPIHQKWTSFVRNPPPPPPVRDSRANS